MTARGYLIGTGVDRKEKFTLFFGYLPIFSNFYQAPFVLEGKHWRCVEQYYHYKKAERFGDEEAMRKILLASKPREQKKLGQRVKNFKAKVWVSAKEDVMLRGVMAKFQQNANDRNKLFKTIGTELVEASPYDEVWGIGLGLHDPKAFNRKLWKGQNLLGEVLMRCRRDLVSSSEYAQELEILKLRYEQTIQDLLKYGCYGKNVGDMSENEFETCIRDMKN